MIVAPARWAIQRCSAGSMIRSAPDTAYQDGSVCQATDPDGVPRICGLIGRCAAFKIAVSFGLRSWAKNCGKNAGSMSTGEAPGVPVKIKWLKAPDGTKPLPRLRIVSPASGTNAVVYTRPSTSDRPKAAFEITIPPYECATRIFGPAMLSRAARTVVTSPLIDSKSSVGVVVL